MGKRKFSGIRPVFEQEIKYLKDKLGIEIPSNKCFMERLQIKAFTGKEKTKILYKIKVNREEMKLEVKESCNYDESKLLNWDEIIQLYSDKLLNLEKESISLITNKLNQYYEHHPLVLTSGGKDSTVLLHLVRSANPNIKAICNNTSNEAGEHYIHLKKIPNLEWIHPKVAFLKYCEQENFIPSVFGRNCCRVYKHETTIEKLEQEKKYLFFMGMRNVEGQKRAEYIDEHNADYYPVTWKGILPIRKWNTLDIWLYILDKKLEFSQIYIKGYSRCGCLICPYRTLYEDILTREYFLKRIKRFEKIQENNFKTKKRWIYLNCTLQEFIDYGWKGRRVREEPTQEVIEEFADYMGIKEEIAKKYFNQVCNCQRNKEKQLFLKDFEVALNLKYLGRKTNKLLCINCLAEYLAQSEIEDIKRRNKRHKTKVKNAIGNKKKELEKNIEQFKSQGCQLF
ncbi:phosphoadenosine phosphosulfate reductase family protein [Anaeromicrobium sediminis]|uniref:Phosphoadenosine phosphosulphate reductase domain-containing protein n=1 Tax=Anaeromicrobium sediminis TaxID=1478221 RepID=A0A267MMI1_9FIRM|nr:phosphoadenosine phosphosulfate reductase family protein [Anaeromicrobium sediminis]PAB60814.1 hypothetical protein CCE28_04575 [Anaeromicrobium sediminis]